MKFPIQLYDINKKILSKNSNIISDTIYFYSYQNFNVEIVEGTGILYSVKNINNALDIQEGQIFSGNFGYTLYITENLTSIKIKVSTDTELDYFQFNLKLDNLIDETNLHYNDLLANNNLPSFNELKDAIPDEFSKQNLIKRLLLDFKSILRDKGTKTCIDKFLEFLGFDDENLTVYDIYKNLDTENLTTNPNKANEIKTGDYLAIYDNWFIPDNVQYDDNNLPVRQLVIKDLDSFSNKLLYAIALANKYFTAEEQYITEFLLNYSSNIPIETSVTSKMNMIFENDIFYFRKFINISVKNYVNSIDILDLVKNCLQKDNNLYKSEIKTYLNDLTAKNNFEIYFIDREFYDDENIPDNIDQSKIERLFACCFHLNIISANTYIKFTVTNTSNPFSILSFDNGFTTQPINKIIVVTETSTYKLNIEITDIYGNTETYYYLFAVNNNIQRIDFKSFCSKQLAENNEIDLDVDNPTRLTSRKPDSLNFILPTNLVPEDLDEYYKVTPKDAFTWLADNSKYIIDSLNGNFKLSDISDTIPLEFYESWSQVLSFKYDSNFDLKLRIFDPRDCTSKIINISEISTYDPTFDLLCVVLLDIYDRNDDGSLQTTKSPYYLITTIETGIEFNKSTYDLVLVSKTDSTNIKSIYDLVLETELYSQKIPINYDFPLFNITSDLVPEFVPYISDNDKITKVTITTEDDSIVTLPLVKSIFNRLTNIENFPDSTMLFLGDIILCKLDNKYIVNERNISWKIINSFTQEILFETTDATLKYRINEKLCYDIICTFTVDSKVYQIIKKNLFSSFNI
jgi:hypothetical protein